MIDGLASAFTCSTTATLQTALKALRTHKHIYVVNLHDTYDAMKARETARRQAEGKNHPSHRCTFFSCCVEGARVLVQCTVYCVCLSEAIEKEKAAKEVQWLQSLDDDQCHNLPNEVKKNIVQQHVAKLRQKKLRY